MVQVSDEPKAPSHEDMKQLFGCLREDTLCLMKADLTGPLLSDVEMDAWLQDTVDLLNTQKPAS